jgi:8-oxo-dGTP pyrophosphatase MutT (NUDIX family)
MPNVVTCLLENNAEILILRRSEEVGTYRELWGGVAGFVEDDEEPQETAIKEIKEEAGIEKKDLLLVKKEDAIKFTDLYEDKLYEWIVYPFLFHIKDRGKIQIDREHTEFRWVKPSELKKYDTVPRFKEIVLKIFG